MPWRGWILAFIHVVSEDLLDLFQSHVVNVELNRSLPSAFRVIEPFSQQVVEVGLQVSLEFESTLW